MKNGASLSRKRKRGKRSSKLLPVLAAFAITLGAGAPLTIAALEQQGIDVPGVSTVRSLMAMLEDRSPGERTKGELSKTKVKLAEGPTQRALGKIIRPAQKELPKSFVEAITPSPAPVIAPPAVPGAEKPVFAALLPSTLPLPPGGGIFAAPGGGGGGGGGGPGPIGETPTNPQVPVPAIPEPGTWAMMLLGFGLTGWVMRRRPGNMGRLAAG